MVANRVDIQLLVEALGRDDALVRRDINRIEENVLQVGIAIATQNPNSVFDVAAEHRMPALEQLVQIAEQLARHRLFGMASGDAQGGAGHRDANAEGLLDGADVRIVLAEQIGKQTWVVEMEFERVFNS